MALTRSLTTRSKRLYSKEGEILIFIRVSLFSFVRSVFRKELYMKFGKFDSKTMSAIGMAITVLGALLSFIGDNLTTAANDDHIRELIHEETRK